MLTSSKPIKVDTSIVRKCADDYGYPSPVSPPVRKPGHLEDVILPSRFINEYTVEDEIGFGGFGFVYAVTRKRDGVELACKFIFKEKISRSSWYNDADLGLVPMEVAVLKNVCINLK